LIDIAAATGANTKADIFLGPRATEGNVKTLDLQRFRVIAFATHGLMAGEVAELDQPALALANPRLTGDRDNDGLLTLDEVLALRINADWVVLSACNTASSSAGDLAEDIDGHEAVSGLGRGFFFAGARSLLVTNWAVETVSARLLTTGLFRHQKFNPSASRAQALREAMLAVMKADPEYSHPAFWAPFSLVGDGGR
jgi:CHAT domain-containing protein